MFNFKKSGYKNIIFFILLIIINFSLFMNKYLYDLDELWIFNMAKNIANGLLPYKDFNMIVTPLLSIVCGSILKMFGTELFIMRILATINCTLIIYLIYNILNILKINKWCNILISFAFIGVIRLDYNSVILLINLIMLNMEIKAFKKNNNILVYDIKSDAIIGILIGLCITLKQTVGIWMLIIIVLYKLILVNKKEKLKEYIKIAVTRVIFACIPVLILIAYLLYNDIWSDFVNYAILGVSEFSNYISYLNLINNEKFQIHAILLPIIYIISIYYSHRNKNSVITVLTVYSLTLIILIFPIADEQHFVLTIAVPFIIFVYYIRYLFIKMRIKKVIRKKYKMILGILTLIISISYVTIGIYGVFEFFINSSKYTQLNNLKYIPVAEGTVEMIKEVDEFILQNENDVYILDASAVMFMIPIDKYNKNYDLFLKGNLGIDSYNSIILDLENKENVKLLLLNDNYELNWQTPVDILDYIKENYINIDSISAFDIYVKY